MLVDDDDGSYRLRCLEDGAWMTACASGTDVVLEADVDDARACGKWRLQGISNGPFYALQSWLTGAWLVARADGALAVDAHSYMLGPEGNERNVVDALENSPSASSVSISTYSSDALPGSSAWSTTA